MAGTKKTTGRAGGSPTRTRGLRASVSNGPLPPYGDPIRTAIQRGDLAEMRRTATYARKWLKDTDTRVSDVRKALEKLDRAIRDLDR